MYWYFTNSLPNLDINSPKCYSAEQNLSELFSQLFCGWVGYGIDNLKAVFVYLSYLSTINHRYKLFEYKRKTIWTLVAEEMYVVNNIKQFRTD